MFVVKNGAIFPLPDAAKPIAGLLFIHLYIVLLDRELIPLDPLLKTMESVNIPKQKLTSSTIAIEGDGFTASSLSSQSNLFVT